MHLTSDHITPVIKDPRTDDPLEVYIDQYKDDKITVMKLHRIHKTMFLAKDKSFTRTVFEHLKNKANVSLIKYELSSRDVNKYLDDELYARLHDMDDLHIVLDNIVVVQKSTHTDGEATIAYVACAFLLCLLTNLARINPDAVKKPIYIYDGLFIKIDGTYVQRFAVMFLKAIKRCAKTYKVELKYIPTSQSPIYFNRLLHVNARLSNDHVIIGNSSYDVFTANTPDTSGNIWYPHTKKMFCQHVMNEKNKGIVKELCYAYKADVALATNALYMTHDQLAFLYYRLIGGKRGVLLSHGTSDDYNYKLHI